VTIVVRPAVLSDARGIATVHVEGWREAYPHLLSVETLARLRIDQRELRWAELIPAARPDIWVAVDDGVVIGWATSSRGHLPDGPRDLELEGLYIRASHYGSGAGQELLDAAIGTQPAFLWVADDNPRAIAFYERNRFTRDGAMKTVPLAGTPVQAARMVR
jgi:ribosomal protein S18 acetylase RimI-like enzyme